MSNFFIYICNENKPIINIRILFSIIGPESLVIFVARENHFLLHVDHGGCVANNRLTIFDRYDKVLANGAIFILCVFEVQMGPVWQKSKDK